MLAITFLDVAAITGLKSIDMILTPFIDPKTNIKPDMTSLTVQPNEPFPIKKSFRSRTCCFSFDLDS